MAETNMLFSLPDSEGSLFQAQQHLPLVVYFYPKDNTAGCTTEAQQFSALLPQFQQLGYQIVGISRDSQKSHQNFINKHQLNITLLSDPDETVCRQFHVIQEKNMYGKKVIGIVRSTFILNEQGQISHAWHKVKAAGHAEQVLTYLQSQ